MPLVELQDAGALALYRQLGAFLSGSVNGVSNLRELLNEGLHLFRSEAERLAAGSAVRRTRWASERPQGRKCGGQQGEFQPHLVSPPQTNPVPNLPEQSRHREPETG